MKENPNFFYSYAKRKKTIRTAVGPFISKDGQISSDPVCEELNATYHSAFLTLEAGIDLPEDYYNSEEDAVEGRPTISTVKITREKIVKAIFSCNSKAGGTLGLSL